VLKDRGYVRIEKKRLMPEDKGRVLTAFLESFFARYVEYDFTADLEEQLDRISNNEMAWRDLLRDFWREFTAAVGDIKELRVAQVIDALDEMLAPHLFPPRADGSDPRKCPNCETGRRSLKPGKCGGFIGCTNYPECRYTRQLAPETATAPRERCMKKLGEDPASGLEVTGPLGPISSSAKLSTARSLSAPVTSVSPTRRPDRSCFLTPPRDVGKQSEDGEPIIAGVGRFGPYVQHGKIYANLTAGDDVLTVGLNRAVALIEEKRAKRAHKGRRGADPGRALGEHPDKGGPVVVKNGRYGPYASHDSVNATLPSDLAPETITLEQAVALLDARSARGGKKRAAAKPRAAAAEKAASEAAPEPKAGRPESCA
jgi:DNA topoisomerase-1